MPTHWATKDLENIKFDEFRYYLSDGQKPKRSWDDVPEDVKKTFDRLGIPEQERKFLAGVEAQYDSEAAYSNIKAAVEEQGVIFVNSTKACTSTRDLPQVVRQGHPHRRQQILRAQQRRVQRRLASFTSRPA
jgi:Fe-S cluster assembly scaffold protein SufB